MDSEADFSPLAKNVKMTDTTEECIIHCTSDNSSLVSLSSIESWKTLLNAATIRKHKRLLEIAKSVTGEEFPVLKYHRQCRGIFTMKSKLASITAKQNATLPDEPSVSSTVRLRKNSLHQNTSGPILPFICIFCEKEQKYKPGSRTREELVQCVELRSSYTIKASAISKNDTRIVGLAETMCFVSAEAKYHFSCYRKYTRSDTSAKTSEIAETPLEEQEFQKYAIVEQAAFSEVTKYIEELLDTPEVVRFTEITSRYVQCIKNNGVSEVKSHTKKNLRRKLENLYGSKIHFVSNDSGHLLMLPDSMSRDDLVRMNDQLSAKLKAIETCSDKNLITAASLIRNEILQLESGNVWPPTLEDLSEFQLPKNTYLFLQSLLRGDNRIQHSSKVSRLIWSLGQDFIHAVTEGKFKTPKHILLPFALKSLSGKVVELTKLLNRCGHGLSYSQIEEIETAIAMQKISAGEEQHLVIPRNIVPNAFTHLAWDNIDRLEETLSGGGTTHRVNGIITQPVNSALAEGIDTQEQIIIDRKLKLRTIPMHEAALQPYNPGRRVGPTHCAQEDDLDFKNIILKSRYKNILWTIMRCIDPKHQVVPSWTGFNIKLRKGIVTNPSEIGYLPTIDAPATSLTTVYEIMCRSLAIKEKLRLDSIAVTFDQALYAKATEVLWKHPEKFQSIVLNLGGFHAICNFMGCIGKRFQDAGLSDLLVEAGVAAEGSLSSIITGKHYNRAVRMHKLVFEAMMRIIWKSFLPWLEEKDTDLYKDLEDLKKELSYLYDNITTLNEVQYSELVSGSTFSALCVAFGQYLDFLRKDNGNLSSLWMSYVDMVEILLILIRATREGDWFLYLSGIRMMIPWCFSYDHLNYARYLPVYYADMIALKSTHPTVYEAFKSGQFSIQMSRENPFGRIPVDQTIEETINKDTQGSSGTTKFSKQPAAVARYYLTSDIKAAFLHMLRNETGGISSKHVLHNDLSPARILKDERDVSSIVNLLTNEWLNPFVNLDIVSISTGSLPTANITKDLLEAHAIGEKAYLEFKSKRFIKDDDSQFHSVMQRQNLKTFTDLKKRKRIKVNEKELILKADRGLFAQMAIVAQRRELDMRTVLSHPLGPLPWALAATDGTIRKTNKAKLFELLSRNFPPAEVLPENAAYVIDGMALVQQLVEVPNTFGLLADKLFSRIVREAYSRIDIVFDTYRSISIKNAERLQRGKTSEARNFSSIKAAHPITKWRQFLRVSENKSELIKFLTHEWQQPKYTNRLGSKIMFVTCEDRCYQVTSSNATEVTSLHSSHEEGDTRLLLHAHHAAKSGFRDVIIHCDDTDVAVITLHTIPTFNQLGCNIFLRKGTINRLKYFNMNEMFEEIGEDMCLALPGLHAFTGCDTVSAFAGKGKATALKVVRKDKEFASAMSKLGETVGVSDETKIVLETFVCRLYSNTTKITSVNELRYILFCGKQGNIESHNLPPCQNTLHKHISRANFQAMVWKKALDPQPDIPSPEGLGWSLQTESDGNSILHIDWMSCAPAPLAVLELLSCSCKKDCEPNTCCCIKNSLKCTDMCKIQVCSNYSQPDYVLETSSDSDADSDDE